MSKYTKPLLAIGSIVLLAALASWFIYPEWRNSPAGALGLGIAALTGVLIIVNRVMDFLKSWKEISKTEKTWEEAPFKKTSPELIRADMGQGGKVSFVNRRATDENLLWQHSKVIITGKMKVGKTREAAEVIRKAIEDDLVPKDQIFEPGQTLRALEASELKEALKSELDTGRKTLLFIDELPKEVIAGEEEKWNAVLKALEHCPEYYVVATGRSDQLTHEQEKWLAKNGFNRIELKGLNHEDVERLVLAAGGVFGLQLSEGARKAFVEESDGRPETTMIGIRRLSRSGLSEIDEKTARPIANDSLETAWNKTTSYLEEQNGGVKYWLDAIGTFQKADVDRANMMVMAYALELWRKEKRWRWGRNEALQEAFEKLENYDVRVRDGLIRYPEVMVEGRIKDETATHDLVEFLVNYRRIWCRPWLRRFNRYGEAHAWALFDLAMGAHDDRQRIDRIKLYDAAIKRMPHSVFYNNRGNAYFDLGQHERAIQDYDKAIELNPEFEIAYYNRGNAYGGLGQHERAIQDFDKAIELNPEDAAAYSNRGVAYADLGQHERAIQDYDRAIESNPEDAMAYYNRGIAYSDLGQHERAIRDYDKAIELNPENAKAYYNRGNRYDDLGQHERAIRDYDKAIDLNPEYAKAYTNRGVAYAALGQHERAIQDYDRAIELNPEYAKAYYNKACAYALGGEMTMAIKWLRIALTMDAKRYCGLIKEDSDFDGIRGEKEFEDVIEEFCLMV